MGGKPGFVISGQFFKLLRLRARSGQMTHFVVAFSQPPFAQYGSTISHMNEKKTEIGLVTLPQLQLLCQIRWKLPRLAFCQIFCIFVVSNSHCTEKHHVHVIYHSKAKIALVGLSTLNRNNDVRVVRYPAITVFCSTLPHVYPTILS